MDPGDFAALAGALGWAVSGVLIKSATVRVRAVKINVVYIFLTASLGLIVAAAAGQFEDVFTINRGDSALLLGGAVVGTTGDLALFRSITIGETATTSRYSWSPKRNFASSGRSVAIARLVVTPIRKPGMNWSVGRRTLRVSFGPNAPFRIS